MEKEFDLIIPAGEEVECVVCCIGHFSTLMKQNGTQ